MIKSKALSAIASLALLTMIGCASDQSSSASPGPTTRPAMASAAGHASHAECLVCKKNVDLACVDVAVEKDTPTYMYNGKTYYFCSDECKDKFAKTPQKYADK